MRFIIIRYRRNRLTERMSELLRSLIIAGDLPSEPSYADSFESFHKFNAHVHTSI